MASAKFFGEYLVDKGIITREQLAEAVKIQQGVKRPLCAMAIEKGFLGPQQLAALDAEIQEADGESVGVEIKDDMMTFKQKKQPYHGMSDKGLYLAEALAQQGYVKLTDLARLFVEYKKEALQTDRQFWMNQHIRETILPSMPHKEIVSLMLQVTIDTFIEYTKQSIRVVGVQEDIEVRHEKSAEYIFTQQVLGDRNFYFVIGLPESLTLAIASHILGQLRGEVDEMVLDAVAEFLNVVLGNALRKLSMKNVKLTARAPSVTTKTEMRRHLAGRAIAIKMKTAVDSFYIILVFEEREKKSRLIWGDRKKK